MSPASASKRGGWWRSRNANAMVSNMSGSDDSGAGADPTEWWRGAAIYQIYLRSFQDSTGNGVGDLAGATRRLSHIRSLGADAVWITPFYPSPMRDFGYDVTDYTGVDPLFGTQQDFDALVAEAHRLGLKVLIDLVLSHTSDQHPWFQESRKSKDNLKADWYVWADAKPDGSPPNNWLSSMGGIAWQFDPRRRQYYLHNFLTEQPDLDFHNPDVRAAALDVMRFWLQRGVDGFRLDVVNYLFHDRQLRDTPPATVREQWPHLVNPYAWQDHIFDISQPENLVFAEEINALMAD